MQVDLDDAPVFVATGGRAIDPAARCLVLVHGAGNDRSVWQLPARYFAHHGYSVLAPDLPAHGRSGGTALDSVGAMADWLVRFIGVIGANRVSLAGHSMGALIAVAAAARLGPRLEKLALLGIAEAIPVHPDLLAAARSGDRLAYDLIVSWGLGPRAQLGGCRAPGIWMAGSGTRLLERNRDGVFAADLAACDAFRDAPAGAAGIGCPTLLVLGERDRLTPVRGGRALAGRMRDARIVVIPDCGHMMLAEKPDETLDALRTIF
jgi:pimeloyl-ACP methyl ester carboxylesterase